MIDAALMQQLGSKAVRISELVDLCYGRARTVSPVSLSCAMWESEQTQEAHTGSQHVALP